MNNLPNKQVTQNGSTIELKFCTRMDKHVDTQQTLEECIGANECFSDDPCPLSAQFKASSPSVRQDDSLFTKI